jgi:hypothetical protein
VVTHPGYPAGFARRFTRIQRCVPSLCDAMLLDGAAEHLRRDLVPYGASTIALVPAGAAPEAPLDVRKCAKDRPGPQPLEPGHPGGDGIPGQEGTKEMDRSRTPFHLLTGNSIWRCNLGTECLDPSLPLAWQHVAAVLGRPDQVGERLVDGMGGAAEDHAAMVRPQTVVASGP